MKVTFPFLNHKLPLFQNSNMFLLRHLCLFVLLLHQASPSTQLMRRGQGKKAGSSKHSSPSHPSPQTRVGGESETFSLLPFSPQQSEVEAKKLERRILSENSIRSTLLLHLPSNPQEDHEHPKVTVHAGKQSGPLIVKFAGPHSPTLSRHKRSRSASSISKSRTKNLLGNISEKCFNGKNGRQHFKQNQNLDLSLRIGQSDSNHAGKHKNQTRKGLNLFKRAESSSHTSGLEESDSAGFQGSHHQLNKQDTTVTDKKLKGILHVGIKGDPNASTELPKIQHYHGQKPSTIIHTFHHKPIFAHQRSAEPNYESLEERRKKQASSLTIYGGKHISPIESESGDDVERKFRHSTRVGFLKDKLSKELIQPQPNILFENGYIYKSISTKHLNPDPNGLHHPEIGILPGSKDGHLISHYYKHPSSNARPSNSEHQTDGHRQPSRERAPIQQMRSLTISGRLGAHQTQGQSSHSQSKSKDKGKNVV